MYCKYKLFLIVILGFETNAELATGLSSSPQCHLKSSYSELEQAIPRFWTTAANKIFIVNKNVIFNITKIKEAITSLFRRIILLKNVIAVF